MIESIDTKPVRASENLDWENLENYLRGKLKEKFVGEFDTSAQMQIEQFPGGHSNLTYLLRFGNCEFVLRRPPFGTLPPKAHDMAREFHILERVYSIYRFAPRPFVLCEDLDVIGAIFYVMERRRGIVIRTEEPAQLIDNPKSRCAVSEATIDALAELHQVDVYANNLDALGKPEGFVARQVSGWTKRWHNSQTSELKEMDALAAWLAERLPPDAPTPTLIHGDFKLDNVMFDANEIGKIVGVFDWEMSAIGDPLVDLGIFLCYWIHAASAGQRDSIASVTDREGYFSREEILESYAAKTDFDLSGITFYEVFAVFKLAVVIQQIYCRYFKGQTDDARFANLNQRVEWLAQIGAKLTEN
ncbi:MAG: phosphotransferase family protein [Pyrinomonadaceae bacterium]